MLAEAGHEIGTHSNTHPHVNKLSAEKNLEEIKAIIQEDPFNRENIAKYRVINFEPSKYKEEFKHCI